jgi:hypothetical protein
MNWSIKNILILIGGVGLTGAGLSSLTDELIILIDYIFIGIILFKDLFSFLFLIILEIFLFPFEWFVLFEFFVFVFCIVRFNNNHHKVRGYNKVIEMTKDLFNFHYTMIIFIVDIFKFILTSLFRLADLILPT